MKPTKLLVDELRKTYAVLEVSLECFNSSPKFESVGFTTGFKIMNESDLDFRLRELQRLGFKPE